MPSIPLPATMSRYRPIYRVVVTNTTTTKNVEFNTWFYKIGTTKNKSLSKLVIYVDRDLGKKLDLCLIGISLRGGALSKSDLKASDIDVGAEVQVYLGYAADEDEEFLKLEDKDLAFTGIVDEVSQSLKTITITAYSNAYKLVREKPVVKEQGKPGKFDPAAWDKKDKTSKDIVEELLSGVLAADSEKYFNKGTGQSIYSYTPDVTKSVYDNIKLLSDINGCCLYVSKAGKVRFHDPTAASTPIELAYGRDILEYTIKKSKPVYDTVSVELNYKDEQGNKQVLSKPLEGSKMAKSKKNEVKIDTLGIIKDQKNAETVANNIMRNRCTEETGELKTLGNTAIDLGDRLNLVFDATNSKIVGAADLKFLERKDKDLIVTRVSHRYSKKSGFTTNVGWKKLWK